MDRPPGEIMNESRTAILLASVLMDEGKYRESVEACIRSAELSLLGMLKSWDLEVEKSGCWEMLKVFELRTSSGISSWLRQCCKRIDRHRAFHRGTNDGKLDRIIDEEYAMEMINYGREIIKFAQRNLFREQPADPSG